MIKISNKKRKTEDRKLFAIMAISVVVMIAAIIIIILAINPKKEEISEENTTKTAEEILEESKIDDTDEIKQMTETQRMKRYVGIFLDNIENEEYQKSYDLLNDEFKNNYFPTLQDFINYVDVYLNTKIAGVQYENIERLGNEKQGNLYVLWVKIGYLTQRKLNENEVIAETNFVILENDYNDFEMSFSVVTNEE